MDFFHDLEDLTEECLDQMAGTNEPSNQPSVFSMNLDVSCVLRPLTPEKWRSAGEESVKRTPLKDCTNQVRGINAPRISGSSQPQKPSRGPRFRIVYGTPSPKKREREQRLKSKKRLKGKGQREPMDYVTITAIALLNAGGRPISTQEIYNFFITYFAKYTEENVNNWKGTVRTKLAKTPEKFTKVSFGKANNHKYVLNLTDPNWVHKQLEALESRRFDEIESLDWYGLADHSVWDAMKAGTLGLPEMKFRDKRFRPKENFEYPVMSGIPARAYPPLQMNALPMQGADPFVNPWQQSFPPLPQIYPSHLDFNHFNFHSLQPTAGIPPLTNRPLHYADQFDFNMPF